MLTLRRSNDRGLADFGWLKSRHSFSFGEYFSMPHMGFSVLRVINEDRIEGGSGFPTHAHKDMEIISYVLEGALDHKDSIGTESTILPGEVQRMSAGKGVRHSEFNHLADKETHFFQMWIVPEAEGLKAGYDQKDFSVQLAQDELFLVVSQDGREGSLTMNQDANLYLAKPRAGKTITLPITKDRRGWFQLAEGEVTIGKHKLTAGDGAAIEKEEALEVVVEQDAHFLFFDLPDRVIF